MTPFRYAAVSTVSEASEMLRAGAAGSRLIAGGTDLLSEIKEGIVQPDTVVSLQNVGGMREIVAGPDGMRLGAMATLTELEGHAEIRRSYAALAEAASSVATPQIRNVGTLGGNLCQRPRCWYYRSAAFDCRKKGGSICFAINGNSKYHAILGGGDCVIVHPSDLAVALVSLRARATIAGPGGERSMALEEFFAGPQDDIMRETVLEPGDVLTHVSLPAPSPNWRSVFMKARERQAQDFALVSVAAAIEVADGVVHDARITLGGVAPVPYRVRQAEEALQGAAVASVDPARLGEMAVAGARPLRDNHYKAPLASNLVRRAVTLLLQDGA